MRRLKIMPEDYEPPKDPFGMDALYDALRAFCKEQSMDVPQFWIIESDGYYMVYAVSLHLLNLFVIVMAVEYKHELPLRRFGKPICAF